MLANTFCSPIVLQLQGRRMIRCLRSLRKGKRAFPSLLKRPLPTVDWIALTVDVCRVDGTLAHPDHVRNWNREEQEWRGGLCDQSQSKSTPTIEPVPEDFSADKILPLTVQNPGKWSNARCDALTTSIFAHS